VQVDSVAVPTLCQDLQTRALLLKESRASLERNTLAHTPANQPASIRMPPIRGMPLVPLALLH